jgi:plastocyanin domain-containing protein
VTLLINFIALTLIGLIVWWFWLNKPRLYSAKTKKLIEITVKDGIYQPAYIQLELNQPITLRFTRKDASPCAEMVIFHSLKISQQLLLNVPTDINLRLEKPGEYEFTCQMGMYRGKLMVK